MKIMIIGANSFLGVHLSNYLKKKNIIIKCGRNKNHDIVLKNFKKEKLSKIFQKNLPDVVINLIALTDVDLCEKKHLKAEKVNSGIIKNIVNSLIEANLSDKIFLLHLSTDQVYSGKGPHKENHTNPINNYGKTKLKGERFVKKINGCILRTNFVGKSLNYKKKSFTDWIFESLNKKKKIQVFNNVMFSTLDVKSLCKYISLVIRKKNTGIYNLGSRNGLSKAQYAMRFAKKLKLNTKLIKIVKYNRKFLTAKRPLDMRMNLNFFEKKFNTFLKKTNHELNLTTKQYINEKRL